MVPKDSYMLRFQRPETKNMARYFKNATTVTSLASGGIEPGPNRAICLG